ncbi:UNVERIFIED_CONTAM: DNA replication and repair protein RecO [Acetivibrio alkalicellulosi]
MSYIKTVGIIIREVQTGEADKIVTIFSKSMGKITGSAKGARRPKSRFIAGTQLLCYSDFVLYKGREIYSINSCDVIEPFYNIRNSLDKLTCAAHMTEIINDIVQENQPAIKVLQLFLNSLHMLSKTDKSLYQIIAIFELRLMSILGYGPLVGGCLNCGNQDFESMEFSFLKCGLTCKKCSFLDGSAMDISEGTAKALNYIIYSNIKNLFCFEVSDQVLRELNIISKRYLKERLEKEYKKMDFIKSLK